jgi:hypothetical protein
MAFGTDPNDVYHNGVWYSRSGTTQIPQVLAQSSIPAILVGLNGTTDAVAVGGLLTFSTALAANPGNCWVYLPTGMVSGRAAGWHYGVGASTTTIQLKNDFVADGATFTPYISTVTANSVGTTTPVAQTTAADIQIFGVVMPGGSLGRNGQVRVTIGMSATSNANAKPVKFFLDASSYAGGAISLANNGAVNLVRGFANRGSLSSQVSMASSSIGSFGAAGTVFTTVDTSVDKSLKVTAQLAVGTDNIVMETFLIEMMPG